MQYKTHLAHQNFRSRRTGALGFSPAWLSTILAVGDALHLPVPAEQGDSHGQGEHKQGAVQSYQTSLLGDSLKTSQGPAKLEVGVVGQGTVRRNYASVQRCFSFFFSPENISKGKLHFSENVILELYFFSAFCSVDLPQHWAVPESLQVREPCCSSAAKPELPLARAPSLLTEANLRPGNYQTRGRACYAFSISNF